MGRSKRNAAGLKSGDAVAHSAPVLTRPTSPQHPVERRRLASALPIVQPKGGRNLGQSPRMPDPPLQPEEGDLVRLVAFFRLLDAWDAPAATTPDGCRLSLIAWNSRESEATTLISCQAPADGTFG